MRTALVKKELLLASAVKKCGADLNDQGQVANDQRCDGLAGNEMRMDEVKRTLPLFSRCTAWAQGRPPYIQAEKSRLTAAQLWTNHCISTGPDVQNDVY